MPFGISLHSVAREVPVHSRKPDQMRADIESLWDGPYCELLACERARMEQLGQRADEFA